VDVGQDFHQPLRWPGHYFDSETGLHDNRFRTYSPELGRAWPPGDGQALPFRHGRVGSVTV